MGILGGSFSKKQLVRFSHASKCGGGYSLGHHSSFILNQLAICGFSWRSPSVRHGGVQGLRTRNPAECRVQRLSSSAPGRFQSAVQCLVLVNQGGVASIVRNETTYMGLGGQQTGLLLGAGLRAHPSGSDDRGRMRSSR